jgi:hypothetical protein
MLRGRNCRRPLHFPVLLPEFVKTKMWHENKVLGGLANFGDWPRKSNAERPPSSREEETQFHSISMTIDNLAKSMRRIAL